MAKITYKILQRQYQFITITSHIDMLCRLLGVSSRLSRLCLSLPYTNELF